MKGFARLSTGEKVYIRYKLLSEQQKNEFEQLHLPSYRFAAQAESQPLYAPSHSYAFSMASYLRMNGTMTIYEIDSLTFIEKRRTLSTTLSERRQQIKQHIEQQFPATLQTEALALLIGDRSKMDEQLATEYRTLGITHLFAISGLHVGLLTYLVRTLMLRVSIRRETVDRFLLLALPIYACLAGGAPSVWRAVTVTMLVLLSSKQRTKLRMDDALAMSAIGFILYEPHIVFQPGFQLSYVAAMSLVYSASILERSTSSVVTSFLVTSITQFALYPILLFHFYEVSISSFLVNLFYVPLYSIIILPMNILLLICSAIVPPAAALLFSLYTPIRLYVGEMTTFIASLPYQLWIPGKPPIWVMLVACCAVLLFLYCFERNKRRWGSYLFLALPVVFIQLLPYADKGIHVSFLDVGQGDCIVIELPYKRAVYVIDTGGTVSFGEPNWLTPDKKFEVGRQIVVSYLKGRGISYIDKLILTHADSDHVEGADELLEELRVGAIHLSPGSENEETMEAVLRIAKEQAIPIFAMQEGDGWATEKAAFYYIAPDGSPYRGNDSSLVLLMQTDSLTVLLTGDLEREGEQRLVKRYAQFDFGNLVLKAGHHGSKTSSSAEFIEFLQPKLAIISAGKNNRYGHPHEEVLETFQTNGVAILSTAEHGTITLSIYDDTIRLSTMNK